MTVQYEDGFINNVLRELDEKSSLCVLGLCLASNDIVLNKKLMDESGDAESVFYMVSSLSILREVAKVIKEIDRLSFKSHFSPDTEKLLQQLREDLISYEEGSLTYDILKPIRDFTFHYKFTEGLDQPKILSILGEMKNETELKVRSSPGDESCLSYRYTFADIFRNEYVNSHLSEDIVNQVIGAAANFIAFTNSVINDLL